MKPIASLLLPATASLMLGGAGLAQEGRFSLPGGTTALADLVDICGRLENDITGLAERANILGWTINAMYDQEETFYSEVTGTRDIPGFGAATFNAFVETYPSRTVRVCKANIQNPGGFLGVEDLLLIDGLYGFISEIGTDIYVTLEEDVPEPTVFVQSYQTQPFFTVQFTFIQPRPVRAKAD